MVSVLHPPCLLHPARTPLGFLQLFDALGLVFPTDVFKSLGENSSRHISHGMETIRILLNKQFTLLSTVCLLDSQFKSYPASLIACAVLYLARKRLGLEAWPQILRENTRQDIGDCQEIVKQLDLIASDFMNQLTPALSAMTMTVSPVKVPPPSFNYRTPTQPRPIRIATSDEEHKYVENEENLHPFNKKLARLHSETSPYSVVVVPSPMV